MPKRYERIGGADAAAVLGKNPYRTRLQVWEEKVHKIEKDIDNFHIRRGNEIEPIIDRYVRENLDPTCNSPENFARWDAIGDPRDYQIDLVHPEYPWLGGHPDGIGDKIVWEYKAPTMRKLDMIGENLDSHSSWITMEKEGIPDTWLYQLQHYLLITGLPYGVLAMWDYDRWRPVIVKMRADKALHEWMLSEYKDFWFHVEMEEKPHSSTQAQYEQVNIIDNDALNEALRAYKKGYSMRYEGKDIQSEEKVKIISMMQPDPDRENTIITEDMTAQIKWVNRYKGYWQITVKERDEE